MDRGGRRPADARVGELLTREQGYRSGAGYVASIRPALTGTAATRAGGALRQAT